MFLVIVDMNGEVILVTLLYDSQAAGFVFRKSNCHSLRGSFLVLMSDIFLCIGCIARTVRFELYIPVDIFSKMCYYDDLLVIEDLH